MPCLFDIPENIHNARHFQVFYNESRKTVDYGLRTICYRAPFLWDILLPEYKLADSLNTLKRKAKNWKGEKCPCRLCRMHYRELDKIYITLRRF